MFREICKPTITADDIIIPIDENATADDTAIIGTFGTATPLIRIGNFLFNNRYIDNFRMTVGNSVLPTVDFTIVDDFQRFKENLNPKNDKCTLFIGRGNNQNYIKLDMLITSVYNYGNQVSVTAEFFNPALYETHCRAFEDFEKCITTICGECEIGALTNYEFPKIEGVKLIQDGCTNLEMLERLSKYASNEFGSLGFCYIDQLCYFNFIDMVEAWSDSDYEKITINPTNYEQLETPIDTVISNKQNPSEDKDLLHFDKYNQTSQFAMYSQSLPSELTLQSPHLYSFEDAENVAQFTETLLGPRTVQSPTPDEYYELFKNLSLRSFAQRKFSQFLNVEFEMNYFIQEFYVGMNIGVELYNVVQPRRTDRQAYPDMTDSEVMEMQRQQYEHVGDYIKNKLLSGDYFLSAITYTYNKSTNKLMQSISGIQKFNQEQTDA